MSNTRAYSLVELIVVMAVIAILSSSLAVVNVRKNLSRARDNRRQTDLESLRSALEQYRYDTGKYITSAGANISTALTPLPTGYVGSLPVDPSSGYYYYYVSPTTTPRDYKLCARLENITPTPSACGVSISCGTGGVCNYQVVNP